MKLEGISQKMSLFSSYNWSEKIPNFNGVRVFVMKVFNISLKKYNLLIAPWFEPLFSYLFGSIVLLLSYMNGKHPNTFLNLDVFDFDALIFIAWSVYIVGRIGLEKSYIYIPVGVINMTLAYLIRYHFQSSNLMPGIILIQIVILYLVNITISYFSSPVKNNKL